MAETTHIEWTEATWNPITGCSLASPGCTNCYAMQLAGTRLAHIPSRAGLTQPSKAGPVWNGQVRFNEEFFDQPLRWKRPRMIFVCAHGDLFHESVPDEWIDRIFAVMALCPQHTFQVLTKRSARMREYVGDSEALFRVARAMAAITGQPEGPEQLLPIKSFPGYFISSHGHVYSERRGERKRLKPDASEQGHLRVPLFREGGPRRGERHLVHRLVLTAFDAPPPSEDAQGRHLDGNPANNAISNLTWGEQSANWEDSKRHGSFRRYAKLTEDQVGEIRERAAKGEAAYSIAKDFPVSDTQIRNILRGDQWALGAPIEWPLRNVWAGVSVEDQQRADERIPDLLATPAAVRWISAEPLLGPVDLEEWLICPNARDGLLMDPSSGAYECCQKCDWTGLTFALDWVVVGGESGPGARPMHPDWARTLRDQCAAADVPFFFKQWGEFAPGEIAGEFLDPEKPARGFTLFENQWSECWSEVDGHRDDEPDVYRLGKKHAGRLLDGVLHDGMPA